MTKFRIGDRVRVVDGYDFGLCGTVTGIRSGYVGKYVVSTDSQQISYRSGRDMELECMQNKKKIYCFAGCGTSSFESKGTRMWLCFRHEDNVCGGLLESPSVEEKVNLILDHLGLQVTVEPQKTVLVEKDVKIPSDQE